MAQQVHDKVRKVQECAASNDKDSGSSNDKSYKEARNFLGIAGLYCIGLKQR